MKQILKISALAAAVVLAGCNQQSATDAEAKLDTPEQTSAYAMGASMGSYAQKTLDSQDELGLKMDRELVIKGFADAVNGKSQLDEKAIISALQEHDKALRPLIEKRQQEMMEESRQKAEDYLKENAEKEGVKSTESGLQYEIIEAGKEDGKKPTLEDTVTVHYTGKLIDGTTFDSSVERGQPATFPLSGVIEGWQEGLQLMPEGSKYKLTIPAELAYGDRPAGSIPPGSVLVFDVELIKIGE
ncbi:FKBP-type peptidyl-prolyl cis-trans isomerase [Endozoicomonas gorgoniicola]|uniref:Peptidyl-prolyl cis-trans isomerase n=1 Tax=Endozoicomonas gorgoniicola TaxID=1234144 RepID=A0ABT3MRD8_9GAMM|nr:FKBP-type peptidyl-prolyl cis-trans isomerase [Endozoicomonas gorgoniicola]MCW7551698.1 FKBP-type peptidyl-prolyl cis-trans isomerase [Endozoicomonas gorgoniicola]